MRAIVTTEGSVWNPYKLVLNPGEPGERLLPMNDVELAELATSIEEIMGAQT